MEKLLKISLIIFITQSILLAQTNEDCYIMTQTGHNQSVESVAISADSKYFLSGGSDYKVSLWDVRSRKEIRSYAGNKISVDKIMFHPDGKRIIGKAYTNIHIWDKNSGTLLQTIKGISVACSQNFKYTVTINKDTVKFWEGSPLAMVRFFLLAEGYHDLNISFDGKYLIARNSEAIEVRDIESFRLIHKHLVHYSKIYSVSPVSHELLVSAENGSIKLINMINGNVIRTFSGNPREFEVRAMAFFHGGNHFVSAGRDLTLRLWDLHTGMELKTMTGDTFHTNCIAVSPDDRYFITGNVDKTIKLWDPSEGKKLHTFNSISDKLFSIAATQNEKYICTGSRNGIIRVWDINRGIPFYNIKAHNDAINLIGVARDQRFVVTAAWDYKCRVFDFKTGKMINEYNAHKSSITGLHVSQDSKYIFSGGWDNSLMKWKPDHKNSVKKFTLKDIMASSSLSRDGSLLAISTEKGLIHLWDVNKWREVKNIAGNQYYWSTCFMSDLKSLITGTIDGQIEVWNIADGTKESSLNGHSTVVMSLACDPDGKYFVSGSSDCTVKLWDSKTRKLVRTCAGHSSEVWAVDFLNNGKRFLSCSLDGSIRIWNVDNEEWIGLYSNMDCSEWLIYTHDGYWDASPNGGSLVAMVQGQECRNIDQFAVRNNRPDIILQRLGSSDKELIDHYYQQYQKRLRKLGLIEDQLTSDLHVPSSTITDTKNDGKFVTLNFKISDDKYKLKQYNIYLNDVPIFGAYGKSITGKSQSLTEKIELTTGDNKIEVSCMNEKGAESYRALTYATYNEPSKGDLYYLAFGVSKYQDQSLNLKYADKDATDLGQVFDKMKGKSFNNVFIKTYTNEQVTVDNIKQAKDFLKNSKVDDTFVLFIAGHGMHDKDKEATYYFLTYDAQVDNLSVSAANFELIEDLLQGIPPRNKLFLMDTCESGELEEGTENTYFAQADTRGLKARAARGMVMKDKSTKETKKSRAYLFEKDRYIYNDLLRRSGAIVFSSSKGGEFSYERDELQNGLFTEEIMNALTTNKADKNNDGIISTDELRDYVSKAVSDLSGDLQHPTVDRDNIYQKFGFGIK